MKPQHSQLWLLKLKVGNEEATRIIVGVGSFHVPARTYTDADLLAVERPGKCSVFQK